MLGNLAGFSDAFLKGTVTAKQIYIVAFTEFRISHKSVTQPRTIVGSAMDLLVKQDKNPAICTSCIHPCDLRLMGSPKSVAKFITTRLAYLIGAGLADWL
jgi:hypothetical protein